MMATRVLTASAILFALTTGIVSAQTKKANEDAGTRSVEGQVVDKSGGAVAHAIVQLKDTKTLQVRSFNTQDDGMYHFAGLSPNVDYELKAEHEGASSGVKTLSVFDSHKTVSITLKLK